MRRTSRFRTVPLGAVPLVAVVLAACTGAPPSPSPEPSPPADARALLRVTTVQALPPIHTFAWTPIIVISLDGRVLTAGAVPAIYPGPLVNPVIERQITAAGWAKIVAAAQAAGLLSGAADFSGGIMPPGSAATRVEIVAGGRLFDFIGDPSRIMVCVTTPCTPEPGSPEAFGNFMTTLSDLSWLGRDLGAESVHVPAGYAIIVGPPPADEPGLAQPPAAWPLAAGFSAFGKPLADGSGSRCGTVTGNDLAALRPALLAANTLTKWRDPVDGSFHGLIVRPLLPGDSDPCAAVV